MKEKLIQLKAQLAALKERIEADDKDAIAEGVKLQGQIDETEKAKAMKRVEDDNPCLVKFIP